MSKRVFNFVSICLSAVGSVAEGLVHFLDVPEKVAISASITAVIGVAITVCGNFVKSNAAAK